MLLSRTTEDHTPSWYFPNGKVTGLYKENYNAVPPNTYYDTEWAVVTLFERFGSGKQRRPDFAVSVYWKDIERIIETLCEAGCADALAVRDAMKLAAAAKELGWQPPQIPTAVQANAA